MRDPRAGVRAGVCVRMQHSFCFFTFERNPQASHNQDDTAYHFDEQDPEPSNAMALSEERTSVEAESSKLLHREVTVGLRRPPLDVRRPPF